MTSPSPRRCVALFSGGLDSMLAVRLMAEQGLRVTAMYARNCFHGTEDWNEKAQVLADRAIFVGADQVVFRDLTADVVGLVKANRHGYGRNLNPCIDCRARTVAEGVILAREVGADFVVTGEVVGQRPMSQRPDALKVTDRLLETMDFGGRLLRPLCALRLAPTLPETEGWVDRERLQGFSGRGRAGQMALAAGFGLVDYPSPAGGCLLTDAGFCGRLADLAEHKPDWNSFDAETLKIGRHYRVDERTKIVASRNETENRLMEEMFSPFSRLYATIDPEGAFVAVVGRWTPAIEVLAAGVAVRHSRHRAAGRGPVAAWVNEPSAERRVAGEFEVMDDAWLEDHQVARTAEAAARAVRRFRETAGGGA